MPTTTTPSSSSPRCVAFFASLRCHGGGRGGGAERRARGSPCGLGAPLQLRSPAPAPAPASPLGDGGCARLDRVAAWVGGGVAAAFFASLERCSCVRVPADDDRDVDARDAAAAPLICHDANAHPQPQLRRTTRAKGN